MHIAVALKKPTVGIMGGGHFGRFYPWGNEKINRVANKHMDCYWCNWECKYPTIRCIQEIEPEVIAQELRSALHEAYNFDTVINKESTHKPITNLSRVKT